MKYIYNGKKAAVIESDNGTLIVQILNVNNVDKQIEVKSKEEVLSFLTQEFSERKEKYSNMIKTNKRLKKHSYDEEDLENIKKILEL